MAAFSPNPAEGEIGRHVSPGGGLMTRGRVLLGLVLIMLVVLSSAADNCDQQCRERKQFYSYTLKQSQNYSVAQCTDCVHGKCVNSELPFGSCLFDSSIGYTLEIWYPGSPSCDYDGSTN